MRTTRYDFAVVGGGPSGSSAARSLARAGASVLVLERSAMPRAKPCGGALSERAISYLGMNIPSELCDWGVFGARVHFGQSVAQVSLDHRIAILVTRARFDHFLLDKAQQAGAHVLYEEVGAIAVEPGCIRVHTVAAEYQAECAIICAGATSKLIRLVRRRDTPAERAFYVSADIPVLGRDPYADLEGLIDIYFGLANQGYGWVFHHGSYYSVGVGGLLASLRSPRALFREFVNDRKMTLDGVLPRGALIPCGGIKRRLTADRLILAGDAAGFVDPFYGEGLAYAIRSGQLAAEVVMRASSDGDLGMARLNEYERLCDITFAGNLKHSLLLTRLMHAVPSVFLRLLASDENVLREYLKVPARQSTYSDYLRWLVPRAPLLWFRSLCQSPR